MIKSKPCMGAGIWEVRAQEIYLGVTQVGRPGLAKTGKGNLG
jgi:hypothetical protein